MAATNLKDLLDEYWRCESLVTEAKETAKDEKKRLLDSVSEVAQRAKELRPLVIKSIKDCNKEALYSRKKQFKIQIRYKKEKNSEDRIEAHLRENGLTDDQIKAAFDIFNEQISVPVEEKIKLKACK